MPLPVKLDTENAVLFLGSGFTSGATAIYGQSPPVGNGLRDILADIIGVPREQYDFKTLGNAFTRRPGLNLFETFRSIFTISSVTTAQKELLSRRWLRIYTTNYDDGAEFAQRINGIEPISYNYDDTKPAKTPRNSIIHLHGMINRATEENVLEQLVLSQKTYVRQTFATSSWYDEFRRDIRFCDAVFFVGYSLQDAHITALIPRSAEITSKTYFITRGMPDQLLKEDIEEYGEIHPIETTGFSQIATNFEKPDVITDFKKFRSLKHVDVFKDNKSILPPTPNEVFDLVTFGIFNERRCLSNLPESNYIIHRQHIIGRVLANIGSNSTILIHSRLGNGKTIIIWSAAYELVQRGYTCFRCVDNSPTIESEIRAVKEVDKLVVLFDSYDIAVSCIDRFTQIVPKAKFIVNVRTGTQQVRIFEIVDKLPQPIHRIDINQINPEDRAAFLNLLSQMGVVKADLSNRINNSNDVRDIVAAIYDNALVKNRINQALKPALSDKKSLATIIVSLVFAWMGQPADVSTFMDVIEVDPFQILARFKEDVSDIFDLESDTVRAKSPIFAEYLIQNQLDIDDVLLVIRRVLVVAVQKKIERKYRTILSSLMSFAQLSRMLRNFPEAGDKIRNLYQELQRDVGIREEPLFWLQYAIAEIDRKRLDLAEGFMITAYDKAKLNEGFETYQLDTQALRLNLLIETDLPSGQSISRLSDIEIRSQDVSRMLSDRSHRYFAVKVLENFRPFVEKRLSDMSADERIKMSDILRNLSDGLGALSPAARADAGADFMKADIELCMKLIASAA